MDAELLVRISVFVGLIILFAGWVAFFFTDWLNDYFWPIVCVPAFAFIVWGLWKMSNRIVEVFGWTF